jgi:putative ABC transport system substrate-binding protein
MPASRRAGLIVVTLVVTLASSSLPGWPQPPHRVGVVYFSGHHQVVVDGLRAGLQDLGLDEGKHIVLDIRETPNDPGAAEQAARQLERSNIDLIYAVTTQATIWVKRATATAPIVFYVGTDPVTAGLVESLAKPGGRLTGIHGLSRDLTAKRLEVLKEIVPKLHRVVTFYNPADLVVQETVRLTRGAARDLGVQVLERPVDSIAELRLGLQRLNPREVQAYLHTPSATATSQAPLIIEVAKTKKLPTMFHEESLVVKGALANYGHNYHEIGRLSAKYVQRVLAGAAPKDLPVENYDKVGLALNLRTAREIGLAIPQAVRVRADRLIE